ncbi:hypothetical protein GDO78_021018 [Eleutherodactylus coqui]|uniref:G-protein coupled receptors family 1 profile domain-containing protein n=1 Tax=Eleutherodactylus coqui TaxID=57060 RepID=A0A8J6C5I7_ELECQ|nr:hypothetical protein GDO78_021018 [Eleutherodactylus coqui]
MNNTLVTEFVLSGLSSDPKLQLPLFLLCLLVYLITLLGNLMITMLIGVTPGLQTPMYFFLMNLSFVDVLYSSSITPNIMTNIFSEMKTISITACTIQMFLFIDLASTEAMMLAAMAYDRYVAICKPLNYTVIMNKVTCITLVCSVYTAGCVNSLIHTCAAFSLPFLISYIYILFTIFRIGSSTGTSKSLSTCISHFTCVALSYGPAFFMYLRPNSAYSVDQDWIVSVFYTVIVPMLNPMIYSLRNQDVKKALVQFNVNMIRCIQM